MTNTGTWNSDLALWFLFAFMLPMFIMLWGRLIQSIISLGSSHVSADVVGVTEEPIRDIQFELHYSKPKKDKKKKKKKKKKTTPEWSDMGYFAEAVEALRGLGLKKAEASSLVQDLCSRKRFASVEELIKEAILCI
jgi:Holliday junction resolvasome RuvABC DNA-binding subunit